jgi:hypothetical protein
MTVMVAEVYDALRDVGVTDEKARRAAEAAADARAGLREEIGALRDETRADFAKIRAEITGGFAQLRQEIRDGDAALRLDFQTLRGEVNTMRWMLGVVLGLSLAILARLLFI